MKKLLDCDVSFWLTKWCEEAQVDPKTVYYKIDHKKRIVYILSNQPFALIGYHGCLSDKYGEKLKEIIDHWHDVDLRCYKEGKIKKKEFLKQYKYKLV